LTSGFVSVAISAGMKMLWLARTSFVPKLLSSVPANVAVSDKVRGRD
jgi:hypothetical protein